MSYLTLRDLEVKNNKVLMRVDFNVPLNELGLISDDTRIKATLPSIEYLLHSGAKLILISHLGSPKGQKVSRYSLKEVAKRLSELLKKPVLFSDKVLGEESLNKVNALNPGEVLLLENLRFSKGEEQPSLDPDFVKDLSRYGDCFVQEAFAAAHRDNASITILPRLFPNKAAVGFLMEKEIETLSKVFKNPERPFIALLGGAKISSKLSLIKTLLEKADKILIGGAMAYTFLKAKGDDIGKSFVEENLLVEAADILNKAVSKKVEIVLPVDHLVSSDLKNGEKSYIVEAQKGIPSHDYGVDIGPLTIALFSEKLKNASLIFWNGPLGLFEVPAFSKGTIEMAKLLASLPAKTIVGGGETVAALKQAGVEDHIFFMSTGGGATLKYIENETLSGIEVLSGNGK